MNTLKVIKLWMNKLLSGACAILLAFMSLLVIYQVFMRYIIKNPSTMSEDILSYSFVWVSLLATALVFGERDHMNLTFFIDKGKPLVKLIISIFSEVFVLVIAFVIFLFGGKGFMDVGALQISPTLGISMNLIYLILPISGVLIIVYNIINIAELIMAHKMKKEVQ